MPAIEPDKIIFSLIGIAKKIEKRQILKDIYLSFFYGAKIGVLGLNGAGKSTLLRIIAGLEKNFEGKVVAERGYSVGFLPQEPLLNETRTVREVVEEGVVDTIALLKEFDRINEKFSEDVSPEAMEKLLARQGAVQEKLESAGAWDLESRLQMAMDALRCPPEDQEIATLSGGEKRRVALTRLLLLKPDILLLDEPTNHHDAESIAWLEQHLARYEGTIIAVTHDRYFLDNVAGWILELDRGEGIPWKGNYSSWLEQKEARLQVEEKQESNRRKALQRELEWIQRNPQGRMAKSKARIAKYESMVAEGGKEAAKQIEIFIPPGPRLGNLVIDAKNLAKSFGEKVLMEDVNFSLPPGGIIGIIGPNGAGKTTLFKMIIDTEQPDAGEIRVGDSVKLAYVEQSREALPDSATVWEAISDGDDEMKHGPLTVNSRSFVSRFGFTGPDQQKKVGVLSGGERNRVHLARMLKSGANVILLDEPTNDLDVNTMRALEEALENFAGCAVIISHDRWFLDRVATHILAFEGDSQVHWFNGNWTAYEQDRRKRMGDEAERPHRIKYRKLTRV